MGRKHGDSWLRKANENCYYCRCLSGNREASCTKVDVHCLPANCENPVILEGKCCPVCGMYLSHSLVSMTSQKGRECVAARDLDRPRIRLWFGKQYRF